MGAIQWETEDFGLFFQRLIFLVQNIEKSNYWFMRLKGKKICAFHIVKGTSYWPLFWMSTCQRRGISMFLHRSMCFRDTQIKIRGYAAQQFVQTCEGHESRGRGLLGLLVPQVVLAIRVRGVNLPRAHALGKHKRGGGTTYYLGRDRKFNDKKCRICSISAWYDDMGFEIDFNPYVQLQNLFILNKLERSEPKGNTKFIKCMQ